MFVDSKSVDRAAKALFNHVFGRCIEIDPRYFWENVPHKVREGFREEVRVVIEGLEGE